MITPERMHQIAQGGEPRTPEEHQHQSWLIARFPEISEERPPRTFPESIWEDGLPQNHMPFPASPRTL